MVISRKSMHHSHPCLQALEPCLHSVYELVKWKGHAFACGMTIRRSSYDACSVCDWDPCDWSTHHIVFRTRWYTPGSREATLKVLFDDWSHVIGLGLGLELHALSYNVDTPRARFVHFLWQPASQRGLSNTVTRTQNQRPSTITFCRQSQNNENNKQNNNSIKDKTTNKTSHFNSI